MDAAVMALPQLTLHVDVMFEVVVGCRSANVQRRYEGIEDGGGERRPAARRPTIRRA